MRLSLLLTIFLPSLRRPRALKDHVWGAKAEDLEKDPVAALERGEVEEGVGLVQQEDLQGGHAQVEPAQVHLLAAIFGISQREKTTERNEVTLFELRL